MAGVAGMGTPKSLQPTVPQDQLDLSQVGMLPNIPTQQREPAGDAELNEFLSMDVGVDPDLNEFLSGSIEQPQTEDERGNYSLESLKQQVEQAPVRLKAGFAKTDQEKKFVLDQAYGEENVKKTSDGFEINKNGKWQDFDSKNFELIGDVLDFGRDVIEQTGAAAGTIAAGAASVPANIVTGGANLALTPAEIAAGRAIGGAAGVATGDLMQSLLGIPRDPSRSRAGEYASAAAWNNIGLKLGDWLNNRSAQKALTNESKKLLPPEELFKSEVDGIKQATSELKQQGLLQNIPGTDTPLLLAQTNPSNKLAKQITEKASGLDRFHQVVEEQSQMFNSGITSFLNKISNFTGTQNIGTNFKEFVQKVSKKEGQLIGDIRKGFLADAGDGELPVPNLLDKVSKLREELGFGKLANGNYQSADDVANNLIENGFDKQGAKVIAKKAEKIFEKISNNQGRLNAKELLGMYEELNGVYRNVVGKQGNIDSEYLRRVGQLRRFVTDELNDKVKVVSGGDTGKSYVKSLSTFSELAAASDELAGVLKNEAINSNALARAIFDKGKDGLDKLNATKVLLKENPDLFQDVVGQYFQNTRAKFFNEATGKTNWNGFLNEVNKLGPDMKEAAFGKESSKVLDAFTKVASAIESGNIPPANSAGRVNLLKNLALSFKSMFAAGTTAEKIINQMDSEKALTQIISKEGIDNFLKNAPGSEKAFLKKMLEKVQQEAILTNESLKQYGGIDLSGAFTKASNLVGKTKDLVSAKDLAPVLVRQEYSRK